MNRQAAFLANLETIKRIIGVICRRNLVPAADQEDFESYANMRLIENDYAVFAKFQGRSHLTTYLNTVIVNYFHDYRASRWGRWRPSAEARRLGPVALRLETLIYRDHCTIRQAIQIMRSQGGELPEDKELYRLAARLPARTKPVEVDPALVATVTPAEDDPETDFIEIEIQRARARASEAIEAAVKSLPEEDAVILRLHFFEGMTVANIARMLQTEQKPLYGRIVKIKARLMGELEKRGINREFLRDILGSDE